MTSDFYAMDTAFYHPLGRYAPLARVEMLKELGYGGTNATLCDDRAWADLPTLVDKLDDHQLRLFSVHLTPEIGTQQYDRRLEEAMHVLAGRTTLIELDLRSSLAQDKRSSPGGDARASGLVNRIADLADKARLRVSLYPHAGFWLERIEDAVRVAGTVGRPNVGVTFNLHHWLAVDGEKLSARLALALPRLWNVTVNGATRRGPGDCTIESLDCGAFDNFQLLGSLSLMGYRGPVGLQSHGVHGDAYANLKRSMHAYRDIMSRVRRHPDWCRLGPPQGD